MEVGPAAEEADCRIVYCGPPGSGKTSNLEEIHRRLVPESRGKLVAPRSEGDPPFRFEFLTVDLGVIRGRRLRLHLYSLPRPSGDSPGRVSILSDADGVVAVLDSRRQRLEDNRKALRRLAHDLGEAGRPPDDVVLALQYNRRDQGDAMDVEELEERLNPSGRMSFEAVASRGEGVMETLEEVALRAVRSLVAPGPS